MLNPFAFASRPNRPIVLCLSGHDPVGGAGLQADIEAIMANGGHAAPAVTALTIQDTVDVRDFQILDPTWVKAQAAAISQDLPIAAIKLGMLGSLAMVECVADIIQAQPKALLVCDPVLRAGGGGSLGPNDVGYAIRKQIFPLATLCTPNLPEAQILAELPEGSADECAAVLLKHCKHLLITGGHGTEQEVHNRLYHQDGTQQTFVNARLPGEYHGSGCTLASALSALLARGLDLSNAVEQALNYTWRCLRDAEAPGRGQHIPRRLPLDYCN